jgi:hypothetical protein
LGVPKGGVLPRAGGGSGGGLLGGLGRPQLVATPTIFCGVSKDFVLIMALMWRGSLRMKRATCALFRDAGCRAVRLSQSTEGLVSLLHIG